MKFSIKFLAGLIVLVALGTNAALLYQKSTVATNKRLEFEALNKQIRVRADSYRIGMPILENAFAGETRLFKLNSSAFEASKDLPFKLYPMEIEDESKVAVLKVPLANEEQASFLAYKIFVPKGKPLQLRLGIENAGVALSEGGEAIIPLDPGEHRIKLAIDLQNHKALTFYFDDKKQLERQFLSPLSGFSSGTRKFTLGKQEEVFSVQFDSSTQKTPCNVSVFIEEAK